jgi:hypothetical protein
MCNVLGFGLDIGISTTPAIMLATPVSYSNILERVLVSFTPDVMFITVSHISVSETGTLFPSHLM